MQLTAQTLKTSTMKNQHILLSLFGLLVFSGCKNDKKESVSKETTIIAEEATTPNVQEFPNNQVFWGNTHLHTSLSGDAFGAGTRVAI